MGAKFVLQEEKVAELMARMEKHKALPGPLMPTLHDAQEIFGCIPLQVQKIIADYLGEPISKVNGVVTFYSRFSIEPKGKHIIAVCLGTACYVRGSQNVIDAFETELGIKTGQTTDDGLYTLEATRCIGACGLAPVFTIDGKVYGKSNPTMARQALKELRESEGGK